MSSAGTPRYTVRIEDELMLWVHAQLASLSVHSPRGDWDVSEFIRTALQEKLAKMKRSREKRRAAK